MVVLKKIVQLPGEQISALPSPADELLFMTSMQLYLFFQIYSSNDDVLEIQKQMAKKLWLNKNESKAVQGGFGAVLIDIHRFFEWTQSLRRLLREVRRVIFI